MELSINDLLIIQDGLNKARAETRGSLAFVTSATGMDPNAVPRIQRKILEIEDLQDRITREISKR